MKPSVAQICVAEISPGKISTAKIGASEICAVEIRSDQWERPRIFDVVQQFGDVAREEMYRTFNMGIGLVMIVAPYYEQSIIHILRRRGESPALIGRVVKGEPGVRIL